MIPTSVSVVFIAVTVILAVCTVWLAFKVLPDPRHRRNALLTLSIGIAAWLAVSALLALSGFLQAYDTKPPRFLILLIVPIAAIILMSRTATYKALLQNALPQWPLYLQFFRVPVEVGLYMAAGAALIPQRMTFEGLNFDILSGLLGPMVAYLCFSKKVLPQWVAKAYNWMGLALLVNIVTIAVLSAPVPFRVFTEGPANIIPAYFPTVWLPAFLVPAALLFHVFSLRQLALMQKKTKAHLVSACVA